MNNTLLELPMNDFKYLYTKSLKLRLIDESVLVEVHKNYSDEELPLFYGVQNKSEIEKEIFRVENGLTTFNKKILFFHLIDKNTERVIGWCGYHTWYTDHDRAEIGYGLYDDVWKRKGLMTEAMEVILSYGFEEMKLHRIEAFIARDNEASFKVLDKFGFRKEGEMREHYFINGKHEDSLIFSLLRVEWEKSEYFTS